MKVKKTFSAKLSIEFKESYTSIVHTRDEVDAICGEYCRKVGVRLNVTPATFFYTHSAIPGCSIELIKNPRVPHSNYDIIGVAIDLAKIFLKKFNQERIIIVSTEQTYMVEKEDL